MCCVTRSLEDEAAASTSNMIAQLRAEGRHEEADQEKHRTKNPTVIKHLHTFHVRMLPLWLVLVCMRHVLRRAQL